MGPSLLYGLAPTILWGCRPPLYYYCGRNNKERGRRHTQLFNDECNLGYHRLSTHCAGPYYSIILKMPYYSMALLFYYCGWWPPTIDMLRIESLTPTPPAI